MPQSTASNVPATIDAGVSPLVHSNRTANAFLGPRRPPRLTHGDSPNQTGTRPPLLLARPPVAAPAAVPLALSSPVEFRRTQDPPQGLSKEHPQKHSSYPDPETAAIQPGLSQASDGSLPSPAPTDGQSPSASSRNACSPTLTSTVALATGLTHDNARSRIKSIGDVPVQQLPTPVLGMATLRFAPGASAAQPIPSTSSSTQNTLRRHEDETLGAAQGDGRGSGLDNQETVGSSQINATIDDDRTSQASLSTDLPAATEAGLSRFALATSNNHPAPPSQPAASNPAGQAAITPPFRFAPFVSALEAQAEELAKPPKGDYSTENARILLLKDACSIEDSFFVALHQLFCIWSLERKNAHGFLQALTPGGIDACFGVLQHILRSNQLVRQSLLQWFSVFPRPLPQMATAYRECLPQVTVFLTKLAAMWPSLTVIIKARSYPLLLDELVSVLHCHSPTQQMVLFTASRRRVDIPGEVWVPKIDEIFREDQAKHRMGDGRFVGLPLDQLKDLEPRNEITINKYRHIASQAKLLAKQQADASDGGNTQVAPQTQDQTVPAQGQILQPHVLPANSPTFALPSPLAASSIHVPRRQPHFRNSSTSSTHIPSTSAASPRLPPHAVSQAQQQIQPRQQAQQQIQPRQQAQQISYPQKVQRRQQAQQIPHLQGMQLQQMQQQKMHQQYMQRMHQQQHYHHHQMIQQQLPQQEPQQPEMLQQQRRMQQQQMQQQRMQHQQILQQQQQRMQQQQQLQLQQQEQYGQIQLQQPPQLAPQQQISTSSAPSSQENTMFPFAMATATVNMVQRVAPSPQQWQQMQLSSPGAQAPIMGSTIPSSVPASPVVNGGQAPANLQIQELRAQLEQQAAQLRATKQRIHLAQLEQQAVFQQQQQGLQLQQAGPLQQNQHQFVQGAAPPHGANRLQSATAAQPQLQLQTAMRAQEAGFQQQEVQWSLQHSRQMAGQPQPQPQLQRHQVGPSFPVLASQANPYQTQGQPSASVQNLPQPHPMHAAVHHTQSHAQLPGFLPSHLSSTHELAQQSPVQLAQTIASKSAQFNTTTVNSGSVPTQQTGQLQHVPQMATVLQKHSSNRPHQPTQLAGQKHARAAAEPWPSSSIFPAPGVRIYRHEQPHDPNDRRALAMSLHQTLLRSPQRQVVDAEAKEALQPNAALESYYQSVQRMALGPVTVAPRTHIYTYEFTVTKEEFTLRPLDSIPDSAPTPVERQFNGSLRYRLRCCVANEGRELTEADWVVQNTSWPDSVFINLNNEPVSIRSRVHNGKDLPAELTHRVRVGTNTLQVVIPQLGPVKAKQYSFGVEVIETISHSHLLLRIEKYALQPANVTAKKIMDRLAHTASNDEDVVPSEEELSVDLADVFIPKIFVIPVRGAQCQHIECFDLFNWLNSRPRAPPVCRHLAECTCADPDKLKAMPTLPDKWRCPICLGDARPCSLVIDGFLLGVRTKLEKAGLLDRTKSIRVAKDGTWRPVTDEPGADNGVDDNDDADETAPAEPRRKTARPDLEATAATASRRTSRPIEVIDLGD